MTLSGLFSIIFADMYSSNGFFVVPWISRKYRTLSYIFISNTRPTNIIEQNINVTQHFSVHVLLMPNTAALNKLIQFQLFLRDGSNQDA